MANEAIELVETQHHEFTVNANFNRGLDPYFAFNRRIKQANGSAERTFTHDGERWVVELTYSDEGGLLPPEGGTTEEGTPINLESVHEYHLNIHRHVSEDPGQEYSENLNQNIHAHVRPRWQPLFAEKNDGSRTRIRHPLDEGVNVRLSGSNIAFKRYLPLFREACDAIGVHRDYFTTPHHTSNVQDAAKYLRLHTHVSGPVHARDGPLAKMGHLLEDDRSGYRKIVQNDDDKYGSKQPGWYHTTTLGPERVRTLFPDHRAPKEFKHYYDAEYQSYSLDEPLRHPKVEVAYQVSRWDETIGLDEVDQLERELDEALFAMLKEAGIDLRAGGKTYVEDAYFDAENVEQDLTIPDLPLGEIKQHQEAVVVHTLAREGGLSEAERGAIGKLVADGGEVSPQEIAEDEDFHIDTVYRALDRIDDLVHREYGKVSLGSDYIGELLHDAIQEAEDSVRRAVDAASKAIDAAKRGYDERTSAFYAWAERYGVNFDGEGDAVDIDLGTIEVDGDETAARRKVRRLVREGFARWKDMNRDPAKFLEGSWSATLRFEEQSLRSMPPQMTSDSARGPVWTEIPAEDRH